MAKVVPLFDYIRPTFHRTRRPPQKQAKPVVTVNIEGKPTGLSDATKAKLLAMALVNASWYSRLWRRF